MHTSKRHLQRYTFECLIRRSSAYCRATWPHRTQCPLRPNMYTCQYYVQINCRLFPVYLTCIHVNNTVSFEGTVSFQAQHVYMLMTLCPLRQCPLRPDTFRTFIYIHFLSDRQPLKYVYTNFLYF